MKKPQLTLREEIEKINKYQPGSELCYRDFTNQLNEQAHLLKDIDEPKGDLQLEFWPILVRVLAPLGMYAAKGAQRLPFLKNFLKVNTKGIQHFKNVKGFDVISRGGLGTIKTVKGSPTHLAAMEAVTNARAMNGLRAIATVGTGAYLVGTGGGFGYGPESAVASMEQWAGGGALSHEELTALAFNPAVYEEAQNQGLTDDIPFNFQSEGELVSIAEMIYDATEGGEKYFAKGLVDFVTMGALSSNISPMTL